MASSSAAAAGGLSHVGFPENIYNSIANSTPVGVASVLYDSATTKAVAAFFESMRMGAWFLSDTTQWLAKCQPLSTIGIIDLSRISKLPAGVDLYADGVFEFFVHVGALLSTKEPGEETLQKVADEWKDAVNDEESDYAVYRIAWERALRGIGSAIKEVVGDNNDKEDVRVVEACSKGRLDIRSSDPSAKKNAIYPVLEAVRSVLNERITASPEELAKRTNAIWKERLKEALSVVASGTQLLTALHSVQAITLLDASVKSITSVGTVASLFKGGGENLENAQAFFSIERKKVETDKQYHTRVGVAFFECVKKVSYVALKALSLAGLVFGVASSPIVMLSLSSIMLTSFMAISLLEGAGGAEASRAAAELT